MSVKATTVQNGKIAIIEVRGSLVGDGETDQFRAEVVDFIEQGNKFLIIDLHKVNYMNSSGVGAIISAYTSYTKNGGIVKLSGLTKNIQNLFTVTKLIGIFDVHDEINDAVKSF